MMRTTDDSVSIPLSSSLAAPWDAWGLTFSSSHSNYESETALF